jgi:hypothetical protein
MKRFFLSLFFGISAFELSGAEALPIMITLSNGQANPGFLVAADKDGLTVSTAPVGGNSSKVPYANIQGMNVEEPKSWPNALSLLNARRYAEAEVAFGKLADDYAALVPWKDGFGSVARLNYFKALKSQGKFKELDAAITRQLANQLVLGEYNQMDFDELKGWALLGKGDVQMIQSYVNNYQDAVKTKWDLQVPFRAGLPARMIASLSYLRAVVHEKQQNFELALVDYHSAMTYNQGTDQSVYAMALEASLRIVGAKLANRPEDPALKRLANSLALLYRDVVGKGKLPSEYEGFLITNEGGDKPA